MFSSIIRFWSVLLLATLSCAADSLPRLAPSPSRLLEWGDINILHTTDTHGWLLGHQKASWPEPNYSGNLGDFVSFIAHMKQIAKEKDVDLLLVDSGDLHDGTGFALDPLAANAFVSSLPYDAMAIGNHELYQYKNAYAMHSIFAPKMNGRYLTSNVNITVADKDGNAISVPLGERYAKFQTMKGRRVTALGVLVNFPFGDVNVTTQRAEQMVTERWFKEAIVEEPDFFLLVGHMPVTNGEWDFVFDAIRGVHPTVPILMFGGHSHIRDCNQPDERSMALQSGRYWETLGWMSVNVSLSGDLAFSRRYLDPNRVTYQYHTGRNESTFDTPTGEAVTRDLISLSKKLDFAHTYGTAPHDYTLSRAPHPHPYSLLTHYIARAVPLALSLANPRARVPSMFLSNAGSQRFDVYAGAFTRNDQHTTSSFPNVYNYIPGVPLGATLGVLALLESNGSDRRRELEGADAGVEARYGVWLEDMDGRYGRELRASGELTPGYVTTDSCAGTGDDVAHAPLPFFRPPFYVGSDPPAVPHADAPVDLVFCNFIQADVIDFLNIVQSRRAYTEADVAQYSPVLATEVLGIYAEHVWNKSASEGALRTDNRPGYAVDEAAQFE